MPENAPHVEFETNYGSFTIGLYDDKAPVTVRNFLAYVDSGFYDGTIFHRIARVPGLVVQGGGFEPGDPLTRKQTQAPIVNEAHNRIPNNRGSVAMARTQEVNSATSQFYINVEDNHGLNYRGPAAADYGYCVFGRIVEGLDVVERIGQVRTGARDMPVEEIVIQSARRVTPSQ